jgi:hypothetical protein
MNDETNAIFKIIFVSVGSYFIGSEYSAALGWGIWFIAMALD